MNEVLARAAEAVTKEFQRDKALYCDTPWNELIARAVIASLREPTNEMIRAGLRVKPTVVETWQAMIDEILKDGHLPHGSL
jgi:hypothetical protein